MRVERLRAPDPTTGHWRRQSYGDIKIVVAARALGERGRMKGGTEDWGVKLF